MLRTKRGCSISLIKLGLHFATYWSIWSTYVFIAKLQILILRKIWKFCMKFGHLIIRKIIKFVATRCQILRLNAPKLISPQTPLEGLQRSPDPLAGFKGPISKGREGERGEGRERNGRSLGEEEEREGKPEGRPRPGLGK